MELYILSLFTSYSLRSQETKGASVMGNFPSPFPFITSPKISLERGPRKGKILQISRERKSSCHMSGPRLHPHLTTFNALEVNYPGESIISFLGKGKREPATSERADSSIPTSVTTSLHISKGIVIRHVECHDRPEIPFLIRHLSGNLPACR